MDSATYQNKEWFLPGADERYAKFQNWKSQVNQDYPPSNSYGQDPKDNVPDWLKGSWAEGWLKGENANEGKGEWRSQEYANTFNKVGEAKSTDEALQDIFADCIPCGFRFQELGNLNILGDILDSIMNWLMDMLAWLMELWAMLNDNSFLLELCSLLNFLNFLCIPDIAAILMILQYYVYEILKGIFSMVKGPFAILWGIISPLMIPILSDLESLIDQWIQMILGPINCIIASLITQLSKLGGLTFGGSSGFEATGITETLWRTFSPDAYSLDQSTGALNKESLPQDKGAWQRDYYNAQVKLKKAIADRDRAEALNDIDGTIAAGQDIVDAEAEIEKLNSSYVTTQSDIDAKRLAALRKALTPDENGKSMSDTRSQGLGELDAIGWLEYIQKISSSTLYTAAKYLLLARDTATNMIDEMKNKLFSFLGFMTNMNRMKLIGLERLKEVIRLINIVRVLLDVIKDGKLKCQENENPGSDGATVPDILTQISNTNPDGTKKYPGVPVEVTNPDTGEVVGYVLTPEDIDPVTGQFLPKLDGVSQVPKSINVNDTSSLKNFVPNKLCFKSTPSDNKKIKAWLAEVAAKEAALGFA